MKDSIYSPKEDSFFFSQFLKEKKIKKNISFLDMGCGSCILSDTLKKKGIKDITCVDINKEATLLAKKKGYKSITSNLFKKIPKEKKFDLICFNAPYLPEDNREPKSSKIITTGGKKGDEISIKFLKQAKKHLKKNGKIYLLISSLTPQKRINKFNLITVARKKMFFEELKILKMKN